MNKHSLRFRLAFTFAWFGALVSLLLSTGLFFAAHNLGQRLMDETLRAEIEDYIARRARNPNSLPPATVSVRGYVHVPGRPGEDIPAPLLALAPGKHQLVLGNTAFRVAVADRGNERYLMLFSEDRQRHREEQFLVYLVSGALIMILVSAGIGWWLAGRVVAPVVELAGRVAKARPENEHIAVAEGFSGDEIGDLARTFDAYLRRMRAFIERERAFTGDVSHEFRTPLAIIQGAVELLEGDETQDPRRRQRIARIARAAHQMISLTSALLLMAREVSADEPVLQDCDVWEVVNDAVDTHRYLLNPGVAVELACHSPLRLAAERTLLGIVVANLVRNAFSYTASGKVAITLDQGCLTVADSGRGISEEEMDKVFDRHFKGSASSGSGIGLSLVKRICDRYGWETVIESFEGRGTTAQLCFAAAPAAA